MKKVFMLVIRIYQYCISPIMGPKCRFFPTCSSYAYESISKYGAIKGSWLAIIRILKCNPLFKGGFDPVP